jgi:hypothetical protein
VAGEIDRLFTQDLETDSDDAAIVQSPAHLLTGWLLRHRQLERDRAGYELRTKR